METITYLHLALADEAPEDINYTLSDAWKNPKLVSTRAAVPLVSLTVVLGILGLVKQASAAVQQGDTGAEVTALQEKLQRLGYLKADATGYFGPLTQQAVMEFQQDKGLSPDGVVGQTTESSLYEYRPRMVEPPHPTWQVGDRDAKVSEIQRKLAMAGYPSSTSGVFDKETEEAVRLFQQARGLKVDGIVGKQTLAELSEPPKNQPQLTPQPEPQKTISEKPVEEPTKTTSASAKDVWGIGDRDSKVSEIQNNLTAAGFPTSTNGVFDMTTQEAVRQFQQAKGLKVDGIVGGDTLKSLSENPKNQQKPQQKKTTQWYEDNSAPLTPFTR